MKQHTSISAYTPSNTDPATLERIFVQREKLLSKIVKQLKQSMTSGDKHHVLLVGPRGCGKTHFVTLVQDRLRKNDDLADSMRIAWLGEDSTITGLIDLAVEIADQLAGAYPDEFAFDFRRSVRSLPPDEAAEAILNHLIDRLGQCHLLLIMENLDRAFHGLGDAGQKKWRAFLQEKGRIATLATSQQLFEAISSRNEAFYGFFDLHHLEPLSVDDARELIAKIARENVNEDLIRYLETSEGRYRVRALHHLAGGNHRMYVLLSEFLTKESLDDLVSAFEQLADELTPYFQERVRSLSPQQARIVQALCNANGALTVKEIAESTFVPERNCSRQLGDLKQKKYVTSEKRGKESYYEMAEPLMRLCLEVKNQRGKPLKLVATFLRAWFPIAVLQESGDQKSGQTRARLYRESALSVETDFEDIIKQELQAEIEEQIRCNRLSDAMLLVEEMICASPQDGLLHKLKLLMAAGDVDTAWPTFNELIDTCKSGELQSALRSMMDGLRNYLEGDHEKALTCFSSSLEFSGAEPSVRPLSLIQRGILYLEMGQFEAGIADLTSALGVNGIPLDVRVMALVKRGVGYEERGDTENAFADLSQAIDIFQDNANKKAEDKDFLIEALTHRGRILRKRGTLKEALVDFNSACAIVGARVALRADALLDRSSIRIAQRDMVGGIADCSAVIDMVGISEYRRAMALYLRARYYQRTKNYAASKGDFERALLTENLPWDLKTVILFGLSKALISAGTYNEFNAALLNAFEQGNPDCQYYGGRPEEMLRLVLNLGHENWREYAEGLVKGFVKGGVGAMLAGGLVDAIARLASGDYSVSQLELWNRIWQEAGNGIEEFEVALGGLGVAVQAIKDKSDRPLFELPLEIREIILPLLGKAVSPES